MNEAGVFMPFLEERASVRRKISDRDQEAEFDSWSVINSPASDYEDSFRYLLEGRNLISFLSDKEAPVVIDLMASPAALYDLFKRLPISVPKMGISVSRSPFKQHEKDLVRRHGIKHLQADLTSGKSWAEIKEELQGRKAHLILERGWFGLSFLPASRGFFQYACQKSWDMLSEENGTMLAQFPAVNDVGTWSKDMDSWVGRLQSGGVEAMWDFGNIHPAIKLVKNTNSPQRLPR